jgi:hypothetical protein
MVKYFAAIAVSGLVVAACASRTEAPQEGAARDPRTTELEVVNRSSSDMDIFVVRSGQRVRLGFAPGNETTRFVLAPAQLAGVGTTYFQASPITGLGRPIGSEPVMVRAGDVITLNIPPP